MQIVKNGLLTGLVLQLALGPVFFFIVNLTLQRTVFDGFFAVLAVTTVDYLYITFSLAGVGKLLEKKKLKKIFGSVSSIVLILFGWMTIIDASGIAIPLDEEVATGANILASFLAAFFLTLSNPLTIVFFTGLFVAKAVEYNYQEKELFIFGFATGAATFLFLGTSVILVSFIGNVIPLMAVQLLHVFVGILLIAYGIIRLVKVVKIEDTI